MFENPREAEKVIGIILGMWKNVPHGTMAMSLNMNYCGAVPDESKTKTKPVPEGLSDDLSRPHFKGVHERATFPLRTSSFCMYKGTPHFILSTEENSIAGREVSVTRDGNGAIRHLKISEDIGRATPQDLTRAQGTGQVARVWGKLMVVVSYHPHVGRALVTDGINVHDVNFNEIREVSLKESLHALINYRDTLNAKPANEGLNASR